jgi:hypothetical protein
VTCPAAPAKCACGPLLLYTTGCAAAAYNVTAACLVQLLKDQERCAMLTAAGNTPTSCRAIAVAAAVPLLLTIED